MFDVTYFALIFGGMLLGIQGERWRAAWVRSEWRSKRRRGKVQVIPLRAAPKHFTHAADQLKHVMAAPFERRRLLSKREAELFNIVEVAVAKERPGCRVMAQVSLGEILASPDKAAFSAINSKRVDMLIVCNRSLPVAAVEYQGEAHYQGSAPARDAVKKEALRRAGVGYIEITPEHQEEDVRREVSRVMKVEQLKRAG